MFSGAQAGGMCAGGMAEVAMSFAGVERNALRAVGRAVERFPWPKYCEFNCTEIQPARIVGRSPVTLASRSKFAFQKTAMDWITARLVSFERRNDSGESWFGTDDRSR